MQCQYIAWILYFFAFRLWTLHAPCRCVQCQFKGNDRSKTKDATRAKTKNAVSALCFGRSSCWQLCSCFFVCRLTVCFAHAVISASSTLTVVSFGLPGAPLRPADTFLCIDFGVSVVAAAPFWPHHSKKKRNSRFFAGTAFRGRISENYCKSARGMLSYPHAVKVPPLYIGVEVAELGGVADVSARNNQ